MRPPSQRMRDCGTGPDSITAYLTPIDPIANADEDGNFVKTPWGSRTFDAIVDSYVATAAAENGSDLSVTIFTILVYNDIDPQIRAEDSIGYRGLTLVAQGDAVRAAAGAWALQAVEVGPNPDGPGLPDGVAQP